MAESSSRVPIVVALITVIGTVSAALIANWDKIFGRRAAPATAAAPVSPAATAAAAPAGATPPVTTGGTEPSAPARGRPTSDSVSVPRRADAIVNLAGLRHDPQMPGNVARIVQDGERFRFENAGVTPQGIGFRSTGTGTVSGTRVRTSYVTSFQTGATVRGDCSGTASPDGAQLTLTCTDPLSGTFVTSGVRR